VAGTRLGPYEILSSIGAGGMGEVYKARDTRLDRIVAIKVAQARSSERFAGEARAIVALNHPNIYQLYDVGADYLVMEYVAGAPIQGVDGPTVWNTWRREPQASRFLVDIVVSASRSLRSVCRE
jgi:serine/threonine protein kinase